MNQKQQKNNKILCGIIGGIILLAIGTFIVYKMVQANKEKKTLSNQKPAENNDKPSQTSPPQTDLPTPSQEEELEKYLLEKRLDLKKYFVFNLGKEVKSSQQEKASSDNLRAISTKLANDLTKLTASYEKKAEVEGYGLIVGKIEELGGIIGQRIPKECVVFFGGQINKTDNEWLGDKLDEKIKNGQNCYVVFEKDDDFQNVYFGKGTVGKNGKRWLVFTNTIFLRMKAPTTYIFQNKKATIDFLKDNDPALIEKF